VPPQLEAAPGPPRAPVAQGSSGAATCYLGSSTHLLAQGSSGAATCHLGSAGCKQLNKYPLAARPSRSPSGRVRLYLPRRYVTRAAPHTRKACSRRLIKCRRDVWQTGCSDPSQCRVVQQLWATGLLQPDVSDMGHLSATTTGLVTQRCSTVSKTECSLADDKTRRAHAIEDIIGYS
jgi:hypothetical protein